ncbi:MAG: glycoside hydrolase family 31 protein [Anaerolineae bacterium]
MLFKCITRSLRSNPIRSLSQRNSTWYEIGAILSYQNHGFTIDFECVNGNVRLEWVGQDLLHVHYFPNNGDVPPTILHQNQESDDQLPDFDLIESNDQIRFRTSSFTCMIERKSFLIHIRTHNDELLCSDLNGMAVSGDGSVQLSMRLQPGERCYGLGIHGPSIQHRGKRFRFRSIRSQPDSPENDTYTEPFYLGVIGERAYGIYWNNQHRGVIELGIGDNYELRFESRGGSIDYFLFLGGEIRNILNRHAELHGRIDIPNLISLGYATLEKDSIDSDSSSRVHSSTVKNYVDSLLTTAEFSNPESIPHFLGTMLNMALSGSIRELITVESLYDVRDSEQYVRMLQATCLMPHIRVDANRLLNSLHLKPIEETYMMAVRQTLNLRKRLIPLIYSSIALSHQYGWPIIQPIFCLEPQNENYRNKSDCFILGDTILIAPIFESDGRWREVNLPVGYWFNFWTEVLISGNQKITVFAPLEQLPIFIRAGTVVPMYVLGNVDIEDGSQIITYRVYPGNGESVLFEDTGDGRSYVEGEYRWIYLSCEMNEHRLVIRRRTAGRYLPPYNRIRLEIVGLSAEPSQVRIDRQGAPIWFVDENRLEMYVEDKFQQIEIYLK